MNSKERISEFLLDEKANVLLVEGKWGIGKTFLVNECIKEYKKHKKIKVIDLSLFGLSSIAEVNQSLIVKSKFSQAVFEKLSKLGFSTSYSDNVGNTISFEVSGVFQALMEEEYKEHIFTQAIIIIDDIERKDRKVSIVEIFGLIDSLKLKKTKVIMIANSEHLCNSSEKNQFIGFKEKIVDYEVKMIRPTNEAIEQLNEDKAIDVRDCDNLRTIEKYNSIRRRFLNDDALKNQIVFESLDFLDNCKADKNEFINKRILLECGIFFRNDDPLENDKNENKIKTKYQKYTDKDIFMFLIENDCKYSSIKKESLQKNAGLIYDCVLNSEYYELAKIKFQFEKSQNKRFPKDFKDFYLCYDVPQKVHDYLKLINDSLTNCEKYDVMSIAMAYYELKMNYGDYFNAIQNDFSISFLEEYLFTKVINEFFQNDYSYEHCDLFDFSNFLESKHEEQVLNSLNEKFFGMMYRVLLDDYSNDFTEKFTELFKSKLCKVKGLKYQLCYNEKEEKEMYYPLIDKIIPKIISILGREDDLLKWEWNEIVVFIKYVKNELNCGDYAKEVYCKLECDYPKNERVSRFKKSFFSSRQ